MKKRAVSLILLLSFAIGMLTSAFTIQPVKTECPRNNDVGTMTPPPPMDGASAQDLGLAPDFSAIDIDGREITLSGFGGSVVVLDFMTRWCGGCWRKVDEVLIPFWSEYKDKGVVMITICWDASASELRALRGGHPGMDWCLISDPDAYPIAVRYNLRTTPTITIVDNAGYMRYKYESGYSPNLTLAQLKEWVDGLLCARAQGDVDCDGDVDGFDLTRMCGAYGSTRGDPAWDEECDVNGDGAIDGYDLTTACENYGKTL